MEDRKHNSGKRIHDAKKFETIKEIIQNVKEQYSDNIAFKFKTQEPGKFTEVKYSEYIDNIEAYGTALISIGLKDKRIGIIGENRSEWEESYLTIIGGVGIVIPLDRSLPENEIIGLIERSKMDAIIYTSKYNEIMKNVRTNSIGKLEYFISMDNDKTQDGIYSMKELRQIGKGLINNGAKSYKEATINPDNMASILFTSGTTSKSKAVMLSNRNICTNVYDITSSFDLTTEDTILSFLPLHHTFEATVGFLYPFSVGSCVVFCEGIRHIAENLKEYQVSVMTSVPIMFESMYKKVLKSIEKSGKLGKVKFGIKICGLLKIFGIDKRRDIFKEIHQSLGGKLRLFVSGGAALDPEVEKGYNDLGINTYQGYGLTETSPVIAAEYGEFIKYGSVGKVFQSLEGKIFNPNEQGIGEIAVKGPSVMLGYYENEEATREVMKDGWFLTGDLGYFDKDDYLFITGRKKNVIVLKNGKNVYPEELEMLISKILGVKESFVYGKKDMQDENDLKLCAKIVYDKEMFKEEYNLTETEEIKDKIWNEIKETNKKMPTYKYIKEIIVTDEEMIKTTTQKVKRHEEINRIK